MPENFTSQEESAGVQWVIYVYKVPNMVYKVNIHVYNIPRYGIQGSFASSRSVRSFNLGMANYRKCQLNLHIFKIVMLY
jgi:hypothetical protein